MRGTGVRELEAVMMEVTGRAAAGVEGEEAMEAAVEAEVVDLEEEAEAVVGLGVGGKILGYGIIGSYRNAVAFVSNINLSVMLMETHGECVTLIISKKMLDHSRSFEGRRYHLLPNGGI